MGKSLKYFMRESAKEDEIVSVPGPDTFVDENGKRIMFEVKVLSNAEITNINDKYRKRTVATDKRGNPYANNDRVLFMTDFDSRRASNHIIAEALQYPNLKDPELMKFFECVDITEMPRKVFPKTDEYTKVADIVMTALGLKDGPTDEQEIEEAKKP